MVQPIFFMQFMWKKMNYFQQKGLLPLPPQIASILNTLWEKINGQKSKIFGRKFIQNFVVVIAHHREYDVNNGITTVYFILWERNTERK